MNIRKTVLALSCALLSGLLVEDMVASQARQRGAASEYGQRRSRRSSGQTNRSRARGGASERSRARRGGSVEELAVTLPAVAVADSVEAEALVDVAENVMQESQMVEAGLILSQEEVSALVDELSRTEEKKKAPALQFALNQTAAGMQMFAQASPLRTQQELKNAWNLIKQAWKEYQPNSTSRLLSKSEGLEEKIRRSVRADRMIKIADTTIAIASALSSTSYKMLSSKDRAKVDKKFDDLQNLWMNLADKDSGIANMAQRGAVIVANIITNFEVPSKRATEAMVSQEAAEAQPEEE